jgi:hypothetical protein
VKFADLFPFFDAARAGARGQVAGVVRLQPGAQFGNPFDEFIEVNIVGHFKMEVGVEGRNQETAKPERVCTS